MENIALQRDIYDSKKLRGEVIWVTIDEKLVHAFVESLGEVFIFHSRVIQNMVPSIDQIEDGQKVELTMTSDNEVISAKLVYLEEVLA